MEIEFFYKSSNTVIDGDYVVFHGEVFEYCDGILEEAVSVGWRVPEYDAAYAEARDLATVLHRIHYSTDSPNFELCDTAAGIMTQIDNMVSGLGRRDELVEQVAKMRGIIEERESTIDQLDYQGRVNAHDLEGEHCAKCKISNSWLTSDCLGRPVTEAEMIGVANGLDFNNGEWGDL